MAEASDSLENPVQTDQHFYYVIGRYNILIEPGLKTEVLAPAVTYPMPNMPEWCEGMFSLRGKLVPVLSLHDRLDSSSAAKWLLVLDGGRYPQIALRVDQLPARTEIPEESFKPSADDQPEWLTQQSEAGEQVFYRANHQRLFDLIINDPVQSMTGSNE